jgi:hypothetical protein
MNGRVRAAAALAAAALLGSTWPALRAAEPADAAFKRFFDARSPQDAAKAIDDIVRSGVAFDDTFARLKRGRAYRADAPRGVVQEKRRSILGDFNYAIDIPESYDAARSWPVRILLHGGVMMRDDGAPRPARGGPMNRTLRGDEQIYLMPTAWRDAPWWSDAQIDNLRGILDTLKRTYNVDENRVALSGVSDGATATYYVAMRDTTPYASFEPLNGFVMVLANDALGVSGDLHVSNLRDKPFFTINGALDPLYPSGFVGPYADSLRRAGVDIDFRSRADGVHNTSWWPEVKDDFETFVRAHPRNPYPARLTWEVGRGDDAHNRAHWLVIDKVSERAEAQIETLTGPDGAPLRLQFRHPRPSGRVEVVRRGNAFDVSARGVDGITLLLSPEMIDFSSPVVVTANGRTVVDRPVQRSVATLLRWAARDNDRTMLFGAELAVKLN